MSLRRKRALRKKLKIALLVVITAIYMFPLYWMVVTSLKTRIDAFTIPPKWIFKPTLDNYIGVFQVETYGFKSFTEFPQNLLNSFLIGGVSLAIAITLGSLAAYSFSRFRIKGKDTWLFFILSMRFLPPAAVVIPIYLFYGILGLLNTHIGLILLYTMFNMPFAVWMMKGFVDEIPRDLDEAALMDGYSRMRVLRGVVLPLATTGLAATAVFCLITVWNEFLFAYILGGLGTRTAAVAVATVRGEVGINWGQIAAKEVIFVTPIVIFTFLLQRHLLRGITFGTVKG